VTEPEKIQKLLDHYKAGRMTREEFWDFLTIVWTETTPVERFAQRHPSGWRR
jgi:hypothetical protein